MTYTEKSTEWRIKQHDQRSILIVTPHKDYSCSTAETASTWHTNAPITPFLYPTNKNTILLLKKNTYTTQNTKINAIFAYVKPAYDSHEPNYRGSNHRPQIYIITTREYTYRTEISSRLDIFISKQPNSGNDMSFLSRQTYKSGFLCKFVEEKRH